MRSQLYKMSGGRRVGSFAGAVEALPQGLGDTRVLLVQCLPFAAQVANFKRQPWCIEYLRCYGLGALAQLNAGMVLAERLPAFEFDQLLHATA